MATEKDFENAKRVKMLAKVLSEVNAVDLAEDGDVAELLRGWMERSVLSLSARLATKQSQEQRGVVEVYTRYGGRHFANVALDGFLYDPLGRHHTLCMGTSSWTLDSWLISDEPHPQGDAFMGPDQFMCQMCIDIVTGTLDRPRGAIESEQQKHAFAKALGEREG